MSDTSLAAEHLFMLTASTTASSMIKNGPQGSRVIVAVTGGSFEGKKLNGSVVARPGGDWVTMRADGSLKLDVRLLLRTNDGADILMTYSGIAVSRDGGMAIRTAPQFETGDERYAWLNNVQGIATGRAGQGTVTYEVYALL